AITAAKAEIRNAVTRQIIQRLSLADPEHEGVFPTCPVDDFRLSHQPPPPALTLVVGVVANWISTEAVTTDPFTRAWPREPMMIGPCSYSISPTSAAR